MEKMWRNRSEMEESRIKNQDLPSIFKKTAMLLFLVIMVTSCQNKSSSNGSVKADVKYTCSMHPQILEDKPGSCPICGMELTIKHQEHLTIAVDSSLSKVIHATNEVVLSDINTITVGKKTVSDTLLLNGMVTYDSNNLKTISARIGGRIEKLFVKYNFQKITKGQKIMEIYSPELAAAQQDLLYVKAKGDYNLLQQTKTKLRLLGVEENQIEQILKTQKVNYRIPIYSTASGYLIDANTAKSNNEVDPSNPATLNTENSSISIIEGQYVKTGDALFKVFNSNNVWADFYANATEASALKKNQAININSNAGNINAKVGLVQPYFYGGQSYSVIRVYLANLKQNFKIGELLQGKIIITPQTGLWIPIEAVYKLGNKNVVFIKQNNVLRARAVKVSKIANARALIADGLAEGDQIASNASYLIDTESFIKTEN
ncbi:Cu(I)/Ag(I) efflux system membrane fusion protein [Pedobacter sp. UYP30]|uniref:HlyD family efflux transporter periplasmic adaptor subunit n=1 Tax=Pedobacter sp. UYP30 TaxID=1756400 RepID=UPI003396D313